MTYNETGSGGALLSGLAGVSVPGGFGGGAIVQVIYLPPATGGIVGAGTTIVLTFIPMNGGAVLGGLAAANTIIFMQGGTSLAGDSVYSLFSFKTGVGGAFCGGLADVWFQTWLTAVGGMQAGGTVPYAVSWANVNGTAGAVLGGTSLPSTFIVMLGGSVLGGVAVHSTTIVPITCGTFVGGTGPNTVFSVNPTSGGAISAGAAAVVAFIPMVGGAVLNGIAGQVNFDFVVGLGGSKLSGAAYVDPHIATGGIFGLGTALVTFLDVDAQSGVGGVRIGGKAVNGYANPGMICKFNGVSRLVRSQFIRPHPPQSGRFLRGVRDGALVAAVTTCNESLYFRV